IQLVAAVLSAVVSFVFSLVLVKAVDLMFGFVVDEKDEIEGLDRTEHGETGFDFGLTPEAILNGHSHEPRPATVPPATPAKRFQVVLEGAANDSLVHAWSELCQPNGEIPTDFKNVYPYVTTVRGNRFQFRGGDQNSMRDSLQKLFQDRLKTPI